MKQYSFDHYYIYSEMTTVLQELAAEYPGLIKMHSICTTADGHEVWATEITNYATGGALEKPAYYVDGSHHAGEVTGSMAFQTPVGSGTRIMRMTPSPSRSSG